LLLIDVHFAGDSISCSLAGGGISSLCSLLIETKRWLFYSLQIAFSLAVVVLGNVGRVAYDPVTIVDIVVRAID
jgi:hypothetical protein